MTEVLVTVAGERAPIGHREAIDIRSPATGEKLAVMARADSDDVDAAVRAARAVSATLADMSARERAALVARAAQLMQDNAERIAFDLASEQGKPITEARGEIAIAVQMWREAAEIVRHLSEELVPSDDPERAVLVTRRPHGVLGVVTPWNFPATIPSEYLCAGLAAGNAIVWKPSELTPLTATHILDCIDEAGFPPGAVNLVPGLGHDTGAALSAHRGIDAIGFTGSPRVGDAIARAAGAKPRLLELGGNNATVVLDDIDANAAAALLAGACYANAGQICSSTERIVVHRRAQNQLAEALVDHARSLRLGPSLDEETTLGPLNNEPTAEKVDRHISDAVAKGAKVLIGGRREDGRPTNLYYQPTVITGLTPQMQAFGEETFGPVAMLVAVESDEEAVEMVNQHALGLTAGVLGDDLDRATAIARRLEAGIVNIGDVATYWQPHTPFGGFSGKRSGAGRLGGRHTIEALSQLQTFVLPRRRLP